MTRAIKQLLLPTALAVLVLLVPAQAANASALEVKRDCADSDVFERKHSRADLKGALNDIPADLAEYGTCRQMILSALAELNEKAKAAGKSGGGGGGGGSADLDGDGVVTPKEKATAAKKAKQKREQRADQVDEVGDALIEDDSAASGGSGGSGGSTTALIVLLVILACGGVGGGLWYASKRNPAVGNALRRVPLPFRNS